MTSSRALCPGKAWLAFVVTACNGCSNEPTRYYEAGPFPEGSTGDGTTMDGTTMDGGPSGPICDPKVTFAAAAAVNGIPAGDKMFGAVTADELTIAWVTPAGGVLVADRSDASQPFGAAQAVPGTFEHDRVALGGDGLTLIAVMTGAKTFGQLKRGARGQAFSGNPSTAPFAMLLNGGNTEIEGGPPGNGNVGDPVLSQDGKHLWFSIFNATPLETVALSDIFGAQWGKPVVLLQPELKSMGGKRRRPTGLSTDGLTLFLWDEVDQKEKVAWRKTATSFDLAFSGFVDLGDKKDAQPTAKCTRLYFTNPPAAPSDVKLADKN